MQLLKLRLNLILEYGTKIIVNDVEMITGVPLRNELFRMGAGVRFDLYKEYVDDGCWLCVVSLIFQLKAIKWLC